MIRRLYLFILMGTLMENGYRIWQWLGYSDDFVYYTVFPTLQRLEICLLPLWWIAGRLWPIEGLDRRKEFWAYLIAGTYLIFQIVDAIDMYTNSNTRSAWIDFFLFGSLNLSYWLVFRRRSI